MAQAGQRKLLRPGKNWQSPMYYFMAFMFQALGLLRVLALKYAPQSLVAAAGFTGLLINPFLVGGTHLRKLFALTLVAVAAALAVIAIQRSADEPASVQDAMEFGFSPKALFMCFCAAVIYAACMNAAKRSSRLKGVYLGTGAAASTTVGTFYLKIATEMLGYSNGKVTAGGTPLWPVVKQLLSGNGATLPQEQRAIVQTIVCATGAAVYTGLMQYRAWGEVHHMAGPPLHVVLCAYATGMMLFSFVPSVFVRNNVGEVGGKGWAGISAAVLAQILAVNTMSAVAPA
jgi:hypothetical protein